MRQQVKRTIFELKTIIMQGDLSLFISIEKLVQDKMFSHQGIHVIKDVDLAEVFEVDVKELRTNVRKSIVRFPSDFMVEINDGEYAFTEPGIIMLGGLLRSERAIKVHLQFIDYFIHLAHKSGISIFDLINRDKK